jgi:uncharacterized protein involved in exopolysaccharide biosynthesis
MTTLTNQEKINVINSHITNLAFNQYNAELSLIEENAKTTPDQESIARLNSQLADYDKQSAALAAELAALSVL